MGLEALSDKDKQLLIYLALGYSRKSVAERGLFTENTISNKINDFVGELVQDTGNLLPYLHNLGIGALADHLGVMIPEWEAVDRSEFALDRVAVLLFLLHTLRAKEQGQLKPSGRRVGNIFDHLHLPACLLAGSGEHALQVYCDWSRNPPKLFAPFATNSTWHQALMDCGTLLFNEAKAAGRSVWNGELARLATYRIERADEAEHMSVFLTFEKTDYISQLATHYSVRSLSDPDLKAALLAEAKDPTQLETSNFANPLSINMAYITKDNFLLVQRRSSKTGHGHVAYQTSAAGFVNPTRDVEDPSTGRLSVSKAAWHETWEEMGERVPEDNLVFLGLVREFRNFEIGLVGTANLGCNYSQLGKLVGDLIEIRGAKTGQRTSSSTLVAKPGADSFEVEYFKAVPFTPRDVLEFAIREGSLRREDGSIDYWANVMPLGALSWLL